MTGNATGYRPVTDTLEIVLWKSDGKLRVLEQRPEGLVRVHGRYWNRALAERRVNQIWASRCPQKRFRKRRGATS